MSEVLQRPRVILADDHSLLLAGLSRLLEETCEVVGTVEDGRTLIELTQQLEPDLVFLDIGMPLLNGIEAARRIKKLCPAVKIIFLTMQTAPSYVTEAFRIGASGYLLKSSSSLEISLAINAALKGEPYITSSLTKQILGLVTKYEKASAIKGFDTGLTLRQREVLQLIGEGKGTKEIASVLKVSVKTIEFHKTCLMKALDIHTTAELMRYAITRGLSSNQP